MSADRNVLQIRMKGFSLIEVMIAAALLAVLGLALFTSLTSTLKGKDRADDISDRVHLARQAMERMANEISMAYLSSNISASPVVGTKFKGESDKIAFDAFGNVPHVKNAKESDQREISYYIGDDPRTKKPALLRKVHNNITLKLGDAGRVDTVCSNVKSLKFRYWDATSRTWKDDWSTEGIVSQAVLPPRIQIELETFVRGEIVQKFMTQTELWLEAPIKILR